MNEFMEEKERMERVEESDPVVDRVALAFLIILLLFIIFVPSEWLLKWSMWWNNIK